MNALVIAELREKQASYAKKAEALRQEWRTLSHGPASVRMNKKVKHLDGVAADYARVIELAEATK